MEKNEAITIAEKIIEAMQILKQETKGADVREKAYKNTIENMEDIIKDLKLSIEDKNKKVRLWNNMSRELNLQACDDCGGVGEDVICHSDEYGSGGCERFYCDHCKGKGYITLTNN